MAGIWRRSRIETLVVAGALGAAVALLTGLSIMEGRIEAIERANARPLTPPLPASQEGLERFAGTPAERCVFAGPGRRLCRWQVEGRLVRATARGGIGDGTKVNLVCELPSDARATGACRAHPVGESRLPAVSAAPFPADPFGSHTTIGALSHALGDVPERCTTGAGSQTCIWSIRPGDAGLEGFQRDPRGLQLRCLLPLDGGARAAGSCEVVARD